MTVSDTSICNRALAKVGTRSTIASLTEQSNEAKQCNLIYTATRDEVEGMAFWNFTTKTIQLALLKSAPGTPTNPTGATIWTPAYPPPPWLYEYAYPTDCIQFRKIVPQISTGVIGVPIFSNVVTMYPYVQGPAVRWEAQMDMDSDGNQINVLVTNQYQAIGVYTAEIVNPALFSAQFVEAFVCALAAKLTIALTGDRGLANINFQLANQYILQARATDGNEGLTVIEYQADWINFREGVGLAMPSSWIAPFSNLYGTI
jgi:hypothetical protein